MLASRIGSDRIDPALQIFEPHGLLRQGGSRFAGSGSNRHAPDP
jgi:hypothetical protein